MANEDKLKALDAAISQIEKQYGKGSVMKLGEGANIQVETVPTGSISLDIALGQGGFPKVVSLRYTDQNHLVRLHLHFTQLLRFRSRVVSQASSMLSMLSILNTLKQSVLTSTIYIYHSLIMVSRHLKSQRLWFVQELWISSLWIQLQLLYQRQKSMEIWVILT
jgi:hypothetical protein